MNFARIAFITVSAFVIVALGSCDGPVEQWSKEVKLLENQLKDAEGKVEQLERAQMLSMFRVLRLGSEFGFVEETLKTGKSIGELVEETVREREKLDRQTEELETSKIEIERRLENARTELSKAKQDQEEGQ